MNHACPARTSRASSSPKFTTRPLAVTLLLGLTLLLGGCAAALVGGVAAGAGATHDRRSFGNVLDDQGIEFAAYDRFSTQPDLKGARIKSVAYNGSLLLIGETRDASQRDLAGRLASEIKGVRRVVNELAIGEHASLWRRGRDGTLTARVKAGLLNLGIKGFDPSRVNVTTVRGEVYLMGLVSHQEAEAVVQRISEMRGVRRVVKVFEYTDS